MSGSTSAAGWLIKNTAQNMKTLPLKSTRAVVTLATTLLCAAPGILRAEEPLPDTTQRMDQTAAQEGDAKASGQISEKFVQFAGSTENAQALVAGLRAGSTITLTSTVDGQVTTTEFQPTTGKLGYGNAFISLALAQQVLAKDGITQPTPAQIEAALNGGSITTSAGETVQLSGVLALRASGQGWGDIAQTLDVKLGHVVGEMHSMNASLGRPDRPEGTGKPDNLINGRSESSARPDTAARPAWAGNPHTVNPGANVGDMSGMIHGHGMPHPGKP